MKHLQADYLVIGRGIAGLRAAIELSRRGSVLVISKRPTTEAWSPSATPRQVDQGSSQYAQGGIAAAMGDTDGTAHHARDTIRAGRGLCSVEAVDVLVSDGVRRVKELIRWGVPFARANGQLHFARESAHSRRRILHARGDATGEAILQTLHHRLRRCRTVRFFNHHFTIDLLVDGGRCAGALVLDESDGGLIAISARAVILATGGAGQLYARTTNPAVCTGDGMAMAYRAGAALQDLEFVQFHPTALAIDRAPAFLITEAMRGEGAVLLNGPDRQRGRRFLLAAHRAGELAPRDLVARAIWKEMERSGRTCVWLDATQLDPDYLRGRFPTVYAACLRYGVDITKTAIPVSPAAHFFMGGITTDIDGASTLPGLYAAGEVACSGVHGANRLASNSLLEGLVFGWRAARAALAYGGRLGSARNPARRRSQRTLGALTAENITRLARPDASSSKRMITLQRELQRHMWQWVGVVRTGDGLEQAINEIGRIQTRMGETGLGRPGLELRNLVQMAELVARSAWRRRGSIGAHYREDYPAKGRGWRHHTVVRVDTDGLSKDGLGRARVGSRWRIGQ
ncbi:MAG TPA: L-aspartate oxidase [Nitrospiria bacterium]|nr:L-aspartate oxidase [Nitrospiria bacterium]